MASTIALFTGLSGMNANARRLDVIGNNISNVNTTAYKSTRLVVETQFTQDFKLGSGPTAELGGTNPGQIGLGVKVSGTQKDFTNGTIQATGDARDLAIDGDGFFIVRREQTDFYTRAGSFRQNEDDNLVTVGGEVLQGYGVDEDFNILPGTLGPINIPLGKLRIAESTTAVTLAGNLNANGVVATSGSLTTLDAAGGAGFLMLDTLAGPGLGPPLTETGLLTQIENPAAPGVPLFADGQTLTFSGVQRGGATVPDFSLAITAATTADDLIALFNGSVGVFDTTTPNPDGTTPGISIDPTTGRMTVTGNTGTQNTIEMDSADIRLYDSAGALVSLPMTANNLSDANGESIRSTMIVYDSLGTPVEVDAAFTLTGTDTTGTTWRYDLFSQDDQSATAPFLSTGTVRFDSLGQLIDADPIPVSVDRSGTGADSPLSFNISLTGSTGRMTALTDTPSEFAAVFRDGLPSGTLETFSVEEDGAVVGAFSNGAFRNLGQVVLAKFANQEGMLDAGGNLYDIGPNSGPPAIVTPNTLASGKIIGGALELSNVDLGQEFVDLIITSTGYSASSRVIRTADELMQQLLVLAR